MRLHALLFACLVLRAHTASLPDKKDIEKKLTDAVKQVLKDEVQVPTENVSSEHELIDQNANDVKDVENNLRKGAQVADIPVKVIVEEVKPTLKTDEPKEDNEVAPNSEESAEIKRVEIDLKNPGPPQRMEHNNQNPNHFDNSQEAEAKKVPTLESLWKSSPQYAAMINNIQKLREGFNNEFNELTKAVENYWSHPKPELSTTTNPEKQEDDIKLRAAVKQGYAPASPACGAAPTPAAPSNPFASWWETQVNNWNTSYNNYITTNNQSANVTNGTNTNWFSWLPTQNTNQSNVVSDEQQNTGPWWPPLNIFNRPPPTTAQSDTPAQPPRPFATALQNIWNNFIQTTSPGQAAAPPSPTPTAQPESQSAGTQTQPEKPVTEEGTNSVPTESKPESEKQKEKPDKPTPAPTQSGPIKQFIAKNPIAQGIAGAVQRIQHTIIPPKPRDEVKSAVDKRDEVKSAVEKKDKEDQPKTTVITADKVPAKGQESTKLGFIPPPPHPHPPGDNNNISRSGVEVKSEPEAEKQEVASKEPTKEETAPVVPEKTE